MDAGQIGFHNEKAVIQVTVEKDKDEVKRVSKTKTEREADLPAERAERDVSTASQPLTVNFEKPINSMAAVKQTCVFKSIYVFVGFLSLARQPRRKSSRGRRG